MFLTQNCCHREDVIILVQQSEKYHSCSEVVEKSSKKTNRLDKESVINNNKNDSDMIVSLFVYLCIMLNILVWYSLPHSSAILICWFVYLYVLFVLYRIYLINN